MKFNYWYLTFIFFSFSNSSFSQHMNTRVQHVIDKKENWRKGCISDERQIVDSFFYVNGSLKEVAYSIIKRKCLKITDSIPIKYHETWDQNNHLLLTEYFNNGEILKVDCNYPANQNIITNGSFEIHDSIPVHKIYSGLENILFKPDKNSKLSQEQILVEKKIVNNDTICKYIVHDSYWGDRQGAKDERHVDIFADYMLVKKNSVVCDSIYIKRDLDYLTPITNFSIFDKEYCNYDSLNINVLGWGSLGRKSPIIYDFSHKAPWHPLIHIANRIFTFETKTGSSFVELTCGKYWLRDCYLAFPHSILRNKLQTTLIKNEEYYLEFWYWKKRKDTLANENKVRINFSQELIPSTYIEKFIENGYEISSFREDTVTGKWTKACLTFQSPSFARYMYVGFNTPPPTRPNTLPDIYLDDFVLVRNEQKDSAINYDYKFDETGRATNNKIVFDQKEYDFNETIQLDNIYFAHNSAELLSTSYSTLKKLHEFLCKNPELEIEIIGHTDDTGKDEFNLQLSHLRAKAVCNYLVESGISPKRLKTVGYGDTKPIADNLTEEGRKDNRRVEIRIVK